MTDLWATIRDLLTQSGTSLYALTGELVFPAQADEGVDVSTDEVIVFDIEDGDVDPSVSDYGVTVAVRCFGGSPTDKAKATAVYQALYDTVHNKWTSMTFTNGRVMAAHVSAPGNMQFDANFRSWYVDGEMEVILQ